LKFYAALFFFGLRGKVELDNNRIVVGDIGLDALV
jgi:hypothetical protein